MHQQTFSLHKVDNETDFSFDPSAYSRFKFGDGAIAEEFGRALARGFIRECLPLPQNQGQDIVVISSPYSFIPTATFAMKNAFVFGLNRWLCEQGLPVVQETKVHRTITYKEDYGELSAAERMRLIGNDHFHIDASFLKGKTLIFLDDIRITGSHERMINRMIGEFALTNDIYMLYFAELINTDIHPNIENYLNYFQVKSIFDLESIVNSGAFVMNTRFVKYLLNYEHQSFRVFLQNQSDAFTNTLYDMALGNGYHTMESYSENLTYIRQQLTANQSIPAYGN